MMIQLVNYFRKYLQAPPIINPLSSTFGISSICSYYPLLQQNSCFPAPAISQHFPSNNTIFSHTAEYAPQEQSSRKVKLLCSFGGKIKPRFGDGTLRYQGGQTRLLVFGRDATLQQVYRKMEDVFGGPLLLYYQLPDQDLDTLVCVSSTEDLDNMMEEYDFISESSSSGSGCGSTKLRVFLFCPFDTESDVNADDGEAQGNDTTSVLEERERSSNHLAVAAAVGTDDLAMQAFDRLHQELRGEMAIESLMRDAFSTLDPSSSTVYILASNHQQQADLLFPT